MTPEVDNTVAMGRLIVECDPTKVFLMMRYHDDEEFTDLACNERIGAELICNWTTTFWVMTYDFEEGTTEVVIRSDCPIPDYSGVQCSDNVPPFANFRSSHDYRCIHYDNAFVVGDIQPGEQVMVLVNPVD